jgi:streptogramin lyase
VIERALAKAPADRFPSAGDLGRAGLAAAEGEDVTARERTVAVGAAAPVEAETRTGTTHLRAPAAPTGVQRSAAYPRAAGRPVRRPPLRALGGIAAAVVLLGAGAGGAALLIADGDPPASPTSTATPTGGARSGPTLTSVSLGGRLNSVATAGGRVWTGGFESPRLHAVAPERAQPIPSLRPEVGVGLSGMTAQQDLLWVIASRDDRLLRIDARSGSVKGKPVTLPSAANAVVAGAGSVWVATTTPELDPGDQILRIDPQTGATTSTLHVPDGVRRLTIAQGGLWLLASNPPRLFRIDLKTGRRVGLRLAGQNAGDLAQGAGALWATLSDADQLARVDPVTRNVTTIAVGRGPAGVAVHRGSVWVANGASSTLSRVSARTRRVIDELEVPLNPYEVAAEGDFVWVTSLAEGKLTRVRVPD